MLCGLNTRIMEAVPVTIDIAFGSITILSLLLFLKAAQWSRNAVIAMLVWTIIVGAVSLTGFFTTTTGMPPRFAPVLAVPLLCIAALFLTRSGRGFIAGLDQGGLVLVHAIRIPVELVLYGLFIHGAVPELMTFTGRNWDILSGLTAGDEVVSAAVFKLRDQAPVKVDNSVQPSNSLTPKPADT